MSFTTIQEGGCALLAAHRGMFQGCSAPSPWVVVGSREAHMSHRKGTLAALNIHRTTAAWKPSRSGKVALLFAILLASAGCTNEDGARRTLEAEGFKSVQITGWDVWSCGKGDDTCTGFEAIGPTGRHVSGAVGCGYLFKGCTVRVSP